MAYFPYYLKESLTLSLLSSSLSLSLSGRELLSIIDDLDHVTESYKISHSLLTTMQLLVLLPT